MKYLNYFTTNLILILIVLKVIDFNNITWLDVIILLLFVIDFILSLKSRKE